MPKYTLKSAGYKSDHPNLSYRIGADDDKTIWSVSDLLNAKFPEPNWVVPGYIPEGLVALGGRPKIGKSFLALQLAKAKATGGEFLGLQVDPGAVLFLALEDSKKRMQNRIKKLGIPHDANINFRFEWNWVTDGGIDDLVSVTYSREYDLIVVDTISRILGRLDQLDMGEMNVIFGQLQSGAIANGIGILLNDHHRKNNGTINDPVDDLLGSTGKSAPLDTVLGLYRDRGNHTASLQFIGREIEDQELRLAWDASSLTWQSLGQANGVQEGTFNAKVLNAIRQISESGDFATNSKIATLLDADEGHVSRALGELLNLGKVLKDEKIGREQPYSLT